MQILRHNDYRRMPWKNGLGSTEEVIAFPPGSDLAIFGWRVSIAHVGADGPFSVFAGIDRTIALLDGDGLLLDLPDGTIALHRKGDPFAFSGDLQIASRNKSGPTIDLNIMTRRGQFRHTMRRVANVESDADADATLFVFNSPCEIAVNGSVTLMERFDTLMCETKFDARLEQSADILKICIFRE